MSKTNQGVAEVDTGGMRINVHGGEFDAGESSSGDNRGKTAGLKPTLHRVRALEEYPITMVMA